MITGNHRIRGSIAIDIIEDQGDVVNVATKPLSDCVDSMTGYFERAT